MATLTNPPPYGFSQSSSGSHIVSGVASTVRSDPFMSSSSFSSTSSTSSANTTATTLTQHPLRKKIRLATQPQEKKIYDILANLFSIIKTTEALEALYSNSAVSQQEYQKQCSMLISHFKTARKKAEMEKDEDIRTFMKTHKLDCPLAYTRLVEFPVPDTGSSAGGGVKVVAETTQHFITLKDALALNIKAVDEIQPLLTDLVDSASRSLVKFHGQERLTEWLADLHRMKASEELSDEQRRQMMHDIDAAYSSFHMALG